MHLLGRRSTELCNPETAVTAPVQEGQRDHFVYCVSGFTQPTCSRSHESGFLYKCTCTMNDGSHGVHCKSAKYRSLFLDTARFVQDGVYLIERGTMCEFYVIRSRAVANVTSQTVPCGWTCIGIPPCTSHRSFGVSKRRPTFASRVAAKLVRNRRGYTSVLFRHWRSSQEMFVIFAASALVDGGGFFQVLAQRC